MAKKVDVPKVAGARIVCVRPMTRAELDRECWEGGRHSAPLAIELDTGMILYPSQDSEGNGPGVLFGNYKGHGVYVDPEPASSGPSLSLLGLSSL